jgi:hypothetical protein
VSYCKRTRDWPRQHFPFRVRESDMPELKASPENNDVAVSGPVNLDWMNAVSLYFSDPDGHEVELCALRCISNERME